MNGTRPIRHLRFFFAFSAPLCAFCVKSLLMVLIAAGNLAAQTTPVHTIEQDVAAAAFGPDGRLCYATRRMIEWRRIEMRRDDIWMLTPDGKSKKIVDGQRIVRANVPFSFAVQSIRWAPDGAKLTVEMRASVFTNYERNETEEVYLTLLLEDSGKEIKMAGADSTILGAANAAWLGDGVTVAFMSENRNDRLVSGAHMVRPLSGRSSTFLGDRTFTAVSWDPPRNRGLGIERHLAMRGQPRLVLLNVPNEALTELAVLDGYLGQLTVSPSGKRVAYFRDAETMEIREIEHPARITRVRVAYGVYAWAPDETRILMKSALERRNGDLYWIRIPAPAEPPTTAAPAASGNATAPPSAGSGGPPPKGEAVTPDPILHGLGFRDFALAHDGKRIAVIEPGKRNLAIYALP